MKILVCFLLIAAVMAAETKPEEVDSSKGVDDSSTSKLKKRGVLGLGLGYPALAYPGLSAAYPALPAPYPYPAYVPATTTFPGYFALRYPPYYPAFTSYTYTFSG